MMNQTKQCECGCGEFPGHICTRGSRNPVKGCRVCGFISTKICDYVFTGGRACNARLCNQHAVSIGHNLDYCADHPGAIAQQGLFPEPAQEPAQQPVQQPTQEARSGRATKALGALFLLALSALAACAQQLPDEPAPRLDLALFTARVAARSLDVTSTNRVLGMPGGYEYELPPSIANHTAALVGFEAAVIGVEMLGERALKRHGHPWLARLVPAIDAAAVSVTVARNYRVRPGKATGTLPWHPIRRQP